MVSIFVQSREAASRLDSAKLQRAPRVVPSTCDATPQGHRLPGMPVALTNGAGEPLRRISTEAPLSIGYLLYLSSVGLIAAGIIAVFFGAGFSLLVPTGGGMMSGSVNRPSPQVMPLPSPVGNAEQQTVLGQASARENEHPAQSSVPLPARPEMPAIDRKNDVPHLGEILVSKAPTDTSTAPANGPLPVPNSPAETALVTPTLGLSNSEVAELLDHGDALLRNGDVASARLFYERAAGAGDGRAALRLGATFDPEFLGRLGLGKLQANPAEARSWYSRALDLGVVDAKRRLNSAQTSRGNSFQ
jgi:hypothetical protein